MKKLCCELCGNPELIKENGFFRCPACDTKYTLEEAKKLLVEVEGTVDVSGSTVRIDTSTDLDNLYQLARRAKAENNSSQASKFYEQILIKRPNDWEAAFYTTYFKAMQCKIAQISLAAQSICNNLVNVLALVKKLDIDEDKRYGIIKEITNHCIYISVLLASNSKDNFDNIGIEVKQKFVEKYIGDIYQSVKILSTLGLTLETLFKDDERILKEACNAWKTAVSIHLDNEGNEKTISQYVEKIKQYEPDYIPPKIPPEKKTNGNFFNILLVICIIGLFLLFFFSGF